MYVKIYVDVMRQSGPQIRKVTTIQRVCSAMNSNNTYKQMLPEVQNYFSCTQHLPVTTSTSERLLSALKRVLTYLWTTLTEKHLNNCMLLHVHEKMTDRLGLVQVAQNSLNSRTNIKIFWQFHQVNCILTTSCMVYIGHCYSIVSIHWINV